MRSNRGLASNKVKEGIPKSPISLYLEELQELNGVRSRMKHHTLGERAITGKHKLYHFPHEKLKKRGY